MDVDDRGGFVHPIVNDPLGISDIFEVFGGGREDDKTPDAGSKQMDDSSEEEADKPFREIPSEQPHSDDDVSSLLAAGMLDDSVCSSTTTDWTTFASDNEMTRTRIGNRSLIE